MIGESRLNQRIDETDPLQVEQPFMANSDPISDETDALHAVNGLLQRCLAGDARADAVPELLLNERNTALLFRVVVEGLSDRFDPRLADIYLDLFSGILERVCPGLQASSLRERYRRIRRQRRFTGDPGRIRSVFVLSRVTLGADVAVTSVFLDAALTKFPNADIYFVGPPRGWELFAAEPRIQSLAVPYKRSGTLAERLSIWPDLRAALDRPDSIILDPDSRLTQLGLLPLGREEDYYFFESRSYGGEGLETLSWLARQWVMKTLDIPNAAPFIRPASTPGEKSEVTVSLGVGDNPAKRIADPFESRLLCHLSRNFKSILVDLGASDEERGRVKRAAASCPGNLRLCAGSFAAFAERIAGSRLYVGYDSAGGHVAAACGVPVVSVFSGIVSERMFARWRPSGPGMVEVIRADSQDCEKVLGEVCQALQKLTVQRG